MAANIAMRLARSCCRSSGTLAQAGFTPVAYDNLSVGHRWAVKWGPFEVGDIRTGKKLHRVDVQGYEQGPVDRHGCPSHGIGVTPDETELWVADGHNKAMHIFDNTVMPPKQKQTIKVRDQPGWITFSIDGRHAYPSTGEVFDTKTKELIIALDDETGRQVGSEKLLEVVMDGDKVTRVGDQFGIGMKK